MIGTTLQQGTFTAVAGTTTLKLRSDIDWLKVYDPVNFAVNSVGFEYFWQRGMAIGTGVYWYHAAASTVVNSGLLAAPLGFTRVDTSIAFPGAAIATTAGTNAVQPVYDTGNTQAMAAGAIVRVFTAGQTNLNGLDFSIDNVTNNVSFRLANTLATAPGAVAGAGTYRFIAGNVDEYNQFYPSRRIISNITQAANGVVTTLVDHSLTTGQLIRINVPAECGMTQLNGQMVTVTVLSVSTFSINVETTNYSAFTFPVAAIAPCQYAEMVPVGIAMAYNTSILAALKNNEFIGMRLGYDTTAAGLAPAGIAGHTMYWIAGNSSNQE
jgi:hypothetical protein